MKHVITRTLAALGVLAASARAQDGMLYLPNTSSYVNVASTADLMPQSGLTVEAWFYFDPTAPGGNNNPTILRKDPGAIPYALRTNSGGGGAFQWIVQTTTTGITGAESPAPLLSWHHAAGTYDGAMMRLYIDGIQVAAVAKTGPLLVTSGPLKIGQGNAPDETWKGSIDEVRIWSVVRTAAQIQAAKLLRLDNQPGLVAAWHFDGNLQDLTGAHHGTAVGTPQILPSTSPVISTYLTAPAISPIGAPLQFQVFTSPPPMPYVLEISTAGTMPGTTIPAPGMGVFPLNQPFLYQTYSGTLPGFFQNFTGITSATGTATATLNVPSLPPLIGIVISSAFVVIDGGAPLGIGQMSNARQTTITDFAPAISAVTPPTGPAAGNWAVTIAGSHFQAGVTVSFDGVPATNVVVTSNAITCLTPAGALGPADVVVQNPDGNAATAPAAFTYVTTLTLAGATPIVPLAGTAVTVTGGGFTPGLGATLGGVPVTVGTIAPGSFNFTMPPGPLCSATLLVTLTDGQTATLNGLNPTPTITSVIGPPGLPSGGTSVFVIGSNFHPGTTVTIGGSPAPITSMTTSAILATAPPGASGPTALIVTSAAGCAAATTYTYQ